MVTVEGLVDVCLEPVGGLVVVVVEVNFFYAGVRGEHSTEVLMS